MAYDTDTSREMPEWVGALFFLGIAALLCYGFYVTFLREEASPEPDSFSRHIPYHEQKEPSAVCEDGTLSYSIHDQGTCSWHGGVDTWLD